MSALRKWGPVAAIALLCVAIAAYFFYAGSESTDDAQVDGHITQIAARVGGTVRVINVMDNQRVKKGDVLVQIAPDDYQIAVESSSGRPGRCGGCGAGGGYGRAHGGHHHRKRDAQRRGGVEQAEAAVTMAERDLEGSRARLSAAQAHQREKQADAARAALDVERFKTWWRRMKSRDSSSTTRWQPVIPARASAEAAAADVTAAQHNVEMAAGRITQAHAGASQAQAALAATRTGPQQLTAHARALRRPQRTGAAGQAALAQAKMNLDYTTVRAAADGIVSKKSVEAGQVIQAGQPLLAIVQLDDVWVNANYKETQLRDIRVGQRARRGGGRAGRQEISPRTWTASRRPRARSSACCPRKTPRAISSRWCSACR
jgi:membrane fusion protein (multidrug efflux system)